jgi:DNA-binding MarR family transcriptional regulator
MKLLKNPFIDGPVVEGDDYCSRKKIEDRILNKLENGHNLALIGDRRIGKSSTAHFVIDGMKGYQKIDIDFYHVTDSTDIAEAIIDASKRVMDKVWDSKKVFEFASRLSPKLEVTETGGLALGVSAQGKEFKKTLNVAFDFLQETITRTDGKVVILFDEFQAIRGVTDGDAILKYMRGKIQKLPRIPFMYVGSIRHEMDHIFRDQSSPFYKQAEIIYFEHIEAEAFFKFLSGKFQSKKIVFPLEVFTYLYQVCYGVTGDIQTFCRVAFDSLSEGTTLNFEAFFYVMDIIYKNEQKYFKGILEGKELTKIQKALLIQLASSHVQENTKIFSKDFQKVIGVKSPGAVTNAIAALEKKEFIYQSEDQYNYSNPFFKEWVLDYRLLIHASAGTLAAGSPVSGTRLDFGYRQRLTKP